LPLHFRLRKTRGDFAASLPPAENFAQKQASAALPPRFRLRKTRGDFAASLPPAENAKTKT